MCRNVFFFSFFFLIINNYVPFCLSHWVTDLKFEMSSNVTDDVTEKSNKNDIFEELTENNSNSTTERDVFWTILDVSTSPTETNVEFQVNTQETEFEESTDKSDILEGNRNETALKNTNSTSNVEVNETNSSQVVLPNETDVPNLTMHEKILLQRNNCRLEISTTEIHDIKVEISFGKLKNNTSGQCCITLNGNENNMLGVLISNIHLYENAFQGEVLKVITANYGLDFVLKEYHSWNKYEPLLLTETHKVYLVLLYNVTNVPLTQEDTHFNLEVFSYGRNENYIHHGHSYSQSSTDNSYYHSGNFSSINSSFFVPFFY